MPCPIVKIVMGESYPMSLDEVLPVFDVAERHEIVVTASRATAFAVLHEVTPREIPSFVVLMGIRGLPAFLMRRMSLGLDRPLLDAFVKMGFVVLRDDPPEEIVLGGIGRFWTLRGGIVPVADADAFASFAAPGNVRAVVNLHVSPERAGDVVVTTETRVQATDEVARRKFARYWRLIAPGSAAIRKGWLRAIKRRAEA